MVKEKIYFTSSENKEIISIIFGIKKSDFFFNQNLYITVKMEHRSNTLFLSITIISIAKTFYEETKTYNPPIKTYNQNFVWI